jgi:ketosteroid isomerase-like protein
VDLAEKLRVVQASYAAFNARDPEALLELYDDDCEWDLSHVPDWPEQALYDGHAGLLGFYEAWLEPWERLELEVAAHDDLPGDRVFILAGGRARGRGSGVDIELPPLGQIIEFRNGRTHRVETYIDVAECRKAAGLAD